MDDTPANKDRPRSDLAAAVRAARADDAERSEALHDLRTVAMARLGVLRDAMQPILKQLPEDADLFDLGIMPSDPPRLFIDMIGFVEMARDRRHYRLFQDRRHGRVLLAEAASLDDAVDAVTAYIARRLVERERALASDYEASFPVVRTQTADPALPARASKHFRRPLRGRPLYWFAQSFWFVVEVLGLLSIFGFLWLTIRWLSAGKSLWPGS